LRITRVSALTAALGTALAFALMGCAYPSAPRAGDAATSSAAAADKDEKSPKAEKSPEAKKVKLVGSPAVIAAFEYAQTALEEATEIVATGYWGTVPKDQVDAARVKLAEAKVKLAGVEGEVDDPATKAWFENRSALVDSLNKDLDSVKS